MSTTLPTPKKLQQSTVIQQIYQSHQQYIQHRIAPNTPIYVACSGGRDSMALLWGLWQLQLPIFVIHVNHQIQSINHQWQIFVEKFCQDHQIPYQSVNLIWSNHSNHINEQQARQARYQKIIDFTGKNAIIALAHHANDQAETILMNLCQGTGLTGLIAMREFSQQTAFQQPVWLWRPLLTQTREQINQWLLDQNIPYIDDPTNFGEHNQRAFLRHQILPKLNQRFGKVVENIQRSANNLANIQTMIDHHVTKDIHQCQLPQGFSHQHRLSIPYLQQLNNENRLQLLYNWLKQNDPFSPNQATIHQVNQLILQNNYQKQTIIQWQIEPKHKIQIRRYQQTLYRLSANYVDLLDSMSQLQPQIHSITQTKTILLQTARYHWQLQWHEFDNHHDIFHVRPVLPAEKLQRQHNHFHEPFKKLCQRLKIPSWERTLANVVLKNHSPFALVLPSISIALAHGEPLDDPNRLQLQLIDIPSDQTNNESCYGKF